MLRAYPQEISSETLLEEYLFDDFLKNGFQSKVIYPLKQYNNFFNSSKLIETNNSILIDSILSFSTYLQNRKHTYTYDDNGRITYSTSYYMSNYGWEPIRGFNYIFDDSGKLINIFHEYWSDNHWTIDVKDSFFYDGNGNNSLILIQYIKDNKLKNVFRITNEFDFKDRLILSITETWADSFWINKVKAMYEYHSQDLTNNFLIQEWQENNWVNYWLGNYYYNDNWELSSIVVKKWISGVWTNNIKTSFTYSNVESKAIELIQTWNSIAWINYQQFSYYYNKNNFFIRGICEYFETKWWVPGDGIIHISNPDGFSEHLSAKEVLAYYTNSLDSGQPHLSDYTLYQNYPNPFNPSTNIKFQIPNSSYVLLKVYDILGREIATLVNEPKSAGNHTAEWNATNFSSGVYIYKITAGEFSDVKKMLLLK